MKKLNDSAAKITDDILVSIDLNRNTRNIIDYSKDLEGNIYGLEDFTFSKDKVYILDTSGKQVISFKSGNIEDTISYLDEGLAISKIAGREDTLFMLDTKDYLVAQCNSRGDIIKNKLKTAE